MFAIGLQTVSTEQSSLSVTTLKHSHLACNSLQGMVLSYKGNSSRSVIRSYVFSSNSSGCSVRVNNGSYRALGKGLEKRTLLDKMPRDLLLSSCSVLDVKEE